ncbi:unnamed protein product [Toxocara canis]|uniref:Golgi apparatus membrane protein TVP18 n=1 Tax=Toxocara canis TaxID=6265 RepID=A0A183UYQ2_TOXCA|nr:unnamed protein product [Toxocara canis]
MTTVNVFLAYVHSWLMGNNSSSTSSGLVEAGSTYVLRHPACKFVTPIRTAVGLITVFVIWLAALKSLISIVALPIGIYLIIIGMASFLLEASYIIRLCCGVDGICCRFFGLILNFDGIRRGILYALFSIFCFIPTFSNNYSIAAASILFVSGCFILVTAVLYLMKPLQMKKAPTYMVDPAGQARGAGSAQVADPTVYGS